MLFSRFEVLGVPGHDPATVPPSRVFAPLGHTPSKVLSREPFCTVRCFLYILCYVCDSGGTVTTDGCDSPALLCPRVTVE